MRSRAYYWPPTGTFATNNQIALSQSVDEGGKLVLVANTPAVPGAFSYKNIIKLNVSSPDISTDILRSINISSASPNNTVNFVISGMGVDAAHIDANGNPTRLVGPITETLAGPNAGETVSSQGLYTVIYSITVTDDDSTNVYVGYGPKGLTSYCILDSDVNAIQGYSTSFSVQFVPDPLVNTTTTVYISLNKPWSSTTQGGLVPFGLINNTQVVFMPAYSYHVVAPGGASYFNYLTNGVQTIWINMSVPDDVFETNDSLFFTVLQQGI